MLASVACTYCNLAPALLGTHVAPQQTSEAEPSDAERAADSLDVDESLTPESVDLGDSGRDGISGADRVSERSIPLIPESMTEGSKICGNGVRSSPTTPIRRQLGEFG